MPRFAPSVVVPLTAIAAALAVAGGAAAGPATDLEPTARLVGEWDPGYAEADLGGDLTIDGYGVGGLGVYPLRVGDGSVVSAVCVQADVGHSLAAEYRQNPTPSVESAELAYLLWQYLRPGQPTPSDDVAAAINVLAWRYAHAQRRGGGPVWQGDEVDIVVTGAGHLVGVERALVALRAEAAARRGPWTLAEGRPAATVDGARVLAVRLTGPGGPIGGEPVRVHVGNTEVEMITGEDGVATTPVDSSSSGPVAAAAAGPGLLVTWSAPSSQRVAVAAPPAEMTITVAPPSTTTTTTPPTTTTTTPTVPPTTTTSTTTTTTTVPPTTTTSTTTTLPSPTTSAPPTTTTTTTTTAAPPATSTTTTPRPEVTTTTSTVGAPPPTTLPRTGRSGRAVVRWGALVFALGAIGVLGATAGLSQESRAGDARRRRSSD